MKNKKVLKILYIVFRVLEVCAGVAAAVLFVLYSTRHDDRFMLYSGMLIVLIAVCELAMALRVYFRHRVKKRSERDRWKR